MPFWPENLDRTPCSDFRVENCWNGMALTLHPFISYLLGLLAMIKCSICSYQSNNWYASNWRLACHTNWGPSRVASGSTPYRVAAGYTNLWYGWNSRSSYHQTAIHFNSHTTNPNALASSPRPSQRSFHSIPIFRLCLKIGRVQCEKHNFGAALCAPSATLPHTCLRS